MLLRWASASVLLLACGLVDCRLRKPPQPESNATGPGGVPTALPPEDAAGTSLKQAAARSQRKLGVALATWYFANPAYPELAAREFDSLTPENEMKWYAVEPRPDAFDFRAGDKLVAFAREHGMRVRGHTLVWHSQLAPWVKPLQVAELRAAMLRHVTKTAEHFKGQIAQWDVVNEALGDDGKLRPESPFTALGPGYLAEAFRAAHAADPNALLFYNDYDVEAPDSVKTQGAYELVKGLKESGAPIHGMGFQMHVDPRRWPSSGDMQRTFERFASLGLLVELTEIDVPVGEIPGTLAQKLDAQKQLARGIVRACLSVESCSGMTLWGLTDRYSWLATAEWAPQRGTGPHLALPFDEAFRKKPMHVGIVEAFAAR